MSRAESTVALRERIKDLEAEVARWRADYKDLALAMARRDGYPMTPPIPAAVPPMLAALPTEVLAAIEGTTEPFSEARTAAIDAARAFLEQGTSPEEVVAALRIGDEVKI